VGALVVAVVATALPALPAGAVDDSQAPSAGSAADLPGLASPNEKSRLEAPRAGDLAGPAPRLPVPTPAVVTPGHRAHPNAKTTSGVFDPATSTVDDSQTTADMKVFRNADGTRTVQYSSGESRFRQGNQWREIDLSLVPAGGEFAPAASPTGLRIGASTATSVDTSAGTFGFQHASPVAAAATNEGKAIRYGAANGRADRVAPLVHGFEDEVVVPDVGGGRGYDVSFTVPQGVVARRAIVTDDKGTHDLGIEFVDSDGTLVARYGGGVASDATGRQASVTTTLVRQSGSTVLAHNEANAAWFGAAGRSFPVTIDPTFQVATANGGYDTYVNSDNPSGAYYAQTELRVGSPGFCEYPYSGAGCPPNRTRTYLYFPGLPVDSGAQISNAYLSMASFQQSGCYPKSLRVYLSAEMVWDTQISWQSQPYVTMSESSTYDPSFLGWEQIPVPDLTDAIVSGTVPDLPLVLFAEDEISTCAFRRYYSAESGASPALYITYNASPSVSSVVPLNNSTVSTNTPTLNVTASDPEGDVPLQYGFDVYNSSNGQLAWSSPGWTTSSSVVVPSGVLSWNTSYYWSADVCDAWGACRTQGYWSFNVYNAPPTVSNPQSPADGAIVLGGRDLDLSSSVSTDPEGNSVLYYIQVTSNGPAGSSIDSGWVGSPAFRVPASSLQDGFTYTWRAYAYDGISVSVSGPRTFKVDRRLGMQVAMPYDTAGPVKVNLFNGNAVISTGGPSFPTVGGALGVSYTYNSQAPQKNGLTGQYFTNCTSPSGTWPTASSLVRLDPEVSFDWGTGSPGSMISTDAFCSRWTGYITVPDAGAYVFGVAHDGGARLTVGPTSSPLLQFDRWSTKTSDVSTAEYAPAVTLAANTPTRIQLEFFDNQAVGTDATANAFVRLFAQAPGQSSGSPISSTWLTPDAAMLPAGWSLSTSLGGGLAMTAARVSESSVTVYDASGAAHLYTKTADGSGYTPPTGEESMSLTRDTDGMLTLQSDDGMTYVFNANGALASATRAVDDRQPAAAQYSWTGDPARLTTITDPVGARSMTFRYSGDAACAAPPSGLFAAPPGMLCAIEYWDSTRTDFWYNQNGRLARIQDPGGTDPVVTDFGYDTGGQLITVIAPLGMDAIASGQATAADVSTTITYVSGRVTSVVLPKASSASPDRPAHRYSYTSATRTEVTVDGLTPASVFARRVDFNATGQLVTDTDATNRSATATWDVADTPLSSTDPAGRATQTIYDRNRRPVDTYGPAPASCFDVTTRLPNGSCAASTITHTHTDYDTGITGLGVTYWNNVKLQGAPKVHGTAAPNTNWGAGVPDPALTSGSWSARYTGELLVPATGTTSFRVNLTGYARVFVGGSRIIDQWSDSNGYSTTGTITATGGTYQRITVEFRPGAAGAKLSLEWMPPGGSWGVVPAANLSPSYGLVTNQVVEDTTSGSPSRTTATSYSTPANGLPTAVSLDPAGLALRTEIDYEAPGAGHYLRRTAKRLPSAAPADPNAYRTSVLGDGPVGYWRLGEAAGTSTASDSSPSGITGTVVGGVTAGQPGTITGNTAMTFDGSTGAIDLGRDSRLQTTQFSVEGWFKSTSSATQVIYRWRYYGVDLHLENGHVKGFFFDSAATQYGATSPETFTDGSWHHAVTTYDGAMLRVYVDGVERASLATTATPYFVNDPAHGAAIGRDGNGTVFYFNGSIDEVAVYPRALTASEVVDHYSAAAPASGYTAVATDAYYGSDTTSTADDPCQAGTQVINQGGALWKHTSVDPDGGGAQTARVEEFVYDSAGRVLARRIGTGSWTCDVYDGRGRVTSHFVPAFGTQPARTATYNYAVGGNRLQSQATDSAGTITTVVDLLGRVASSTDVWGKTTTTSYDQAGRAIGSSGPAGVFALGYDDAGRVTSQTRNGATLATAGYTSTGELNTVSYPSGTGNAGNGSSLAALSRDSAGRVTGQTWLKPGGTTLTSDAVTYSQSGRVVDETIDGADVRPSAANFLYDTAGRLTDAWVPGHTISYGFASGGGCGASAAAGKNTNRTSLVDNGVSSSYCYDFADRLTSTTAAGVGSIAYDSHGNTTTLGNQTLTYDGDDRHVNTQTPSSNIAYVRDATGRIVQRTVATPTALTASFVGSASNVTSGAGSLSVNKPAGVTAGDVLVAEVSAAGGTGTTMTKPDSSWTALDVTSNGTSVVSGLYWKVATASEPTGYSWTLSPSAKATAGIAAYHNVDQTAPVEAWSVGTATGSSVTAPSVTAAGTGGMLIQTAGIRYDTSLTPNAGMTEHWEAHAGGGSASTRVTNALSDAPITAPGATGTRTTTAANAGPSVTHLVALRAATQLTVTSVTRYSFGGGGDSPTATLDSSNNVIEATVGLLGGVLLTTRAAGNVWSYPNLHGDVAATADQFGVKQGATISYDPYGQVVAGSTPDNSNANLDYGWLGQHQRGLEHEGSINTIEMGARQYAPALGRFLEVDPVLGASCNDYDYSCGDSVNGNDLNGQSPESDTFYFELKDVRLVSDSGWYDYGVPLGFSTRLGGAFRVTQNRFVEWEIHATRYHKLASGDVEFSSVIIRYQERMTRTRWEGSIGTEGGPSGGTGGGGRVVRRQWRLISSTYEGYASYIFGPPTISLGNQVRSF
jgi:RHS repeat-associated protein